MDVDSLPSSPPDSNQEEEEEDQTPDSSTLAPEPSSESKSPPPPPPPVAVTSAGGGGPRPAPAYTIVKSVIEKKEDGPGCRCGHTLTAVAAVGVEGTPEYIGPRLILFGGATALEGNAAASPGPPSPTGGNPGGIRMRILPFYSIIDYFQHSINKIYMKYTI